MTGHHGLIVTCEHASNAVPPDLDLGVDEAVLESHVAWDPGAKEIAERLARALSAPLSCGAWTRLVADLNRSPDNPDVVPARAFGVDVPGNTGLSAADRQRRIRRYHEPYWHQVIETIEPLVAKGAIVCHLSVHSFTPVYQGVRREAELGVLIDPERPGELDIARQLRRTLWNRPLEVRVNEPYDGREDALTTAMRKRFPPDRYLGVELEFNQALQNRFTDIADQIIPLLLQLAKGA